MALVWATDGFSGPFGGIAWPEAWRGGNEVVTANLYSEDGGTGSREPENVCHRVEDEVLEGGIHEVPTRLE